MPRLFIFLLLLLPCVSDAGVYGTLEFGDDRETVTRKLQASPLVEATVDNTFFGRTGLNGIFKCKNKLAGLTYRLYFEWSETGGLSEITLRSQEMTESQYDSTLKTAWAEANKLFTQVYAQPVQSAAYPAKSAFKTYPILITHMWHKDANQSILIGPGLDKKRSFLTIRFVNKKLPVTRTP